MIIKPVAERVSIPPKSSWCAVVCCRRLQLEGARCTLHTVFCGSQSKALNVPTHLVDFNAILFVGSVSHAEVRAFFTEKVQPAIKSIRPGRHSGCDCGPPCHGAEQFLKPLSLPLVVRSVIDMPLPVTQHGDQSSCRIR